MLNQQLIPIPPLAEPVLLYGRLQAVDEIRQTAQLNNYGGETVNLEFPAGLDAATLNLANQYVKVAGYARFENPYTWPTIYVEQVTAVSRQGQPFDLPEFLNRPNPKLFDPDQVVTVSEPFDVDDFNRIIREGRNVGRDKA